MQETLALILSDVAINENSNLVWNMKQKSKN